jgi:hypothetical protein
MRTEFRQGVEQFIAAAVFQPRPAAPKRLSSGTSTVLGGAPAIVTLSGNGIKRYKSES